MALVLDAGALIALERGDPKVIGALAAARNDGVQVRTSSAVVAQVRRDGTTQARVAIALRGAEEVAVDHETSRRIGELLAAAGGSDIVDAAVVLTAETGDKVVTSDPSDIVHLADAAGIRVTVIGV